MTNSRHIKSVVKLSDLKLFEEDGKTIVHFDHPHVVKLRKGPGIAQKDTAGHTFSGPRNKDGPRDVAVLYHYNSKSRKEYYRKRQRGRAPLPKNHSSNAELLKEAMANMAQTQQQQHSSTKDSTLYDDTVWEAMKTYVPAYAVYDELDSVIPS